MVAIGARRPDVVAITAAMLNPTGLTQFAAAYRAGPTTWGSPSSTRDQRRGPGHGRPAPGGGHLLHVPHRAFDQTLMDVALHRLPVTLVLDRAGVTGPDGASHHGMWDGSLMQLVPA